MEIPVTIQFDETPVNYIIVRAFPTRDRATMDAQMVFGPPHLNPRAFDLTVPTPEPHIVIVYDSLDGVALGIIRSSFFATPKFFNGIFIDDLVITVNGGTVDGDGGAIDPVADTRVAAIPSIANYTIARIYRNADGRYIRKTRDPEWIPRGDGGFNLQLNAPVFYDQESLTIEFAPYYDTNVGAEIFDLTQMLLDHINDTDNPHSVTKDQVGLSNIPNAISNRIDLNDPNVLATSKAVNDLRLTIENVIIFRGKIFVGDVSDDKIMAVPHNQNITTEYVIAGSLVSTGSNWNQDNDVLWMTRRLDANSFDLLLKEVSGNFQSLWFYYVIVKL